MKTQKLGAVIGIAGAVYLVVISWTASWWYVPFLTDLGRGALESRTSFGGNAFSILWGISGVLGAMIVALGAALYAKVGARRVLLLVAGCVVLMAWLALWSAISYEGAVFGIGGGLILLFLLWSSFDWARTRAGLKGARRTAADLRLAANLSFFITAWGLCGLLGAPIFALQPQLAPSPTAGTTMAVKVLVCLVLGWGFTALAQSMERRAQRAADPGDD